MTAPDATGDAEGDLRHCIAIASQSQPDWRPVWESALATLLPDATSPASQVGMEAPLGRNETLIERLEATHTLDTPRETRTGRVINPDGPEAAKAIRDLEAENARLRSAPIPAVQSGAVAWRSPEEIPPVRKGVEGWYLVAVYRKATGSTVTFQTAYLNAMMLEFEDEDDTGESYRPMTGWADLDHDDDAQRYSPLHLAKGDRFMGWAEMPRFDGLAAPQSEPLPGVREPFTVDDLAQEIRRVDGNYDLGAGALAEALSPFIIERIYRGLVAVSSPPLPGGVEERVLETLRDELEDGALFYCTEERRARITAAILAALSGKEQG